MLQSREATLTTEERGELMKLKDVIGEVGERERETLLGSNLEREEQVLRQEADVLASCLAHGMLKVRTAHVVTFSAQGGWGRGEN